MTLRRLDLACRWGLLCSLFIACEPSPVAPLESSRTPVRAHAVAAAPAAAVDTSPTWRIEVLARPGKRPFSFPVSHATVAPRYDIMDVAVTDEPRIAALVRPGDLLLESVDHGRTWSVTQLNMRLKELMVHGKAWLGLGVIDEAGRATWVVDTNDRGRTWDKKATGRTLKPEPVSLIRHGNDVVLGADDYLVWSRDKGRKWDYIDPKIDQVVSVITCSDQGQWWVGGIRGAVAFRDAQKNWHPERLPLDVGRVNDIAVSPRGDAWAATRKGMWHRHEGRWREHPGLAQRHWRRVAFTPTLGVALGTAGRVALSDDGGDTWSDVTPQLREALKLEPAAWRQLHWRDLALTPQGVLLFGDDAVIVRVR